MFALYAEWLHALEQSGLGHLARHSAWTFTVANVLHVLGAALVVGGIAVFDLKLLLRAGHAAETSRAAIPLAAFGLALQIPTGLVLLAAEASALGHNPAFLYKLGFIGLGLANVALFHGRMGAGMRHGPFPRSARIFAGVSLLAWTGALVAGRMIAYL
jgi:hypothetical protein